MPEPNIVLIGPGPQFKGGIANFNSSLARALDRLPGCRVHLISWTNQYPAIIPRDFKVDQPQENYFTGTAITIEYLLDYNNPLTWRKVARKLSRIQPMLVIFQWVNNVQAFPIRYLCKRIKQNTAAEIQFVLHVVKQKETSVIDKSLTRHGFAYVDTFIAHSTKSIAELREVLADELAQKRIIQLYHPVYDMFRPDPSFDAEAFKTANGIRRHAFLFFGFIRKYKGLHLALRALHRLVQQRQDVTLMICGEFFLQENPTTLAAKFKYHLFNLLKTLLFRGGDQARHYDPLALVEELQLQDHVYLQTNYIPDGEVLRYFQSATAAVCFYETADASGIESICYNFGTPILATRVGHFPESIQDGDNGYLADAGDIDSMAAQMLRSIEAPIPAERVRQKAEELSWKRYAQALLPAALASAGSVES
ncbi:MAG: glycosyltransferase family 4 protein [Bacteroidota bacterium]